MVDRIWKTDVWVTVTDINKGNGRAREAIFAAQNSAGKLIDKEEGDSFWENFNVISPTKSSTTGEFREYTDTTYVASKKADTKVKPVYSNRDNGFTRADTLRGKLTPLRTCYDVTFYDLDVKVDIDNKSISGSNKMRFKVTEPFSRMQVDLYANMQIHKIMYGDKELPYTESLMPCLLSSRKPCRWVKSKK
jgi:hypothetical protein